MNLAQKARPNKDRRTVIFVTFESEFSKSGGLGAVMSLLPQQMAQYEECFVLAPYFENITDLDILARLGRIKGSCTLPPFSTMIGKRTYTVGLVEIVGPNGFRTCLLSSGGFFTAKVDPYANPLDPTEPVDPYSNPIHREKLIEDALFFCAAVPKALVRLGKTTDLILQLQDWETACVAQAVKREPDMQSVACVLSLHNPYDAYLGDPGSDLVSDLMSHLGLQPDNVLVQMIPLVDGPVSTVSQNFARELRSDLLHTHVFADQLQDALRSKGLVGIDDGIFGKPAFPFSSQAEEQAEQGDFRRMQQEKRERREELGQVIEEYQRELADLGKEAWGADLELSDPWLPVFLVLGRDDPRQKGFDVIAEAIRHLPEGKARYIFTPIPGTEGLVGLGFLKKLAQDRPGEVKVFPFRLDPVAFRALQRGSSFMVMGSLYEPFGAANEAYLAGMPVVARATGGLVQQVVPHSNASLSPHGRQLVALFHDKESAPTGFLYREPSGIGQVQGWRKIVDCAYWDQEPKGGRIDDRKGIPLFEAMVQSAARALQDAIDLYRSNQIEYASMVYSGFKMLGMFSWDRAVREYRRLYDLVCNS